EKTHGINESYADQIHPRRTCANEHRGKTAENRGFALPRRDVRPAPPPGTVSRGADHPRVTNRKPSRRLDFDCERLNEFAFPAMREPPPGWQLKTGTTPGTTPTHSVAGKQIETLQEFHNGRVNS